MFFFAESDFLPIQRQWRCHVKDQRWRISEAVRVRVGGRFGFDCKLRWPRVTSRSKVSTRRTYSCRGDGSKQEFLRVKVTPQEVSYGGGKCSIDDKQQDGDKIAMRVTCKFTSGAVMGSAIAFTKKDSKTLRDGASGGPIKMFFCIGVRDKIVAGLVLALPSRR